MYKNKYLKSLPRLASIGLVLSGAFVFAQDLPLPRHAPYPGGVAVVKLGEPDSQVREVLFGGADFNSLSDADIDELAREIPTVHLGISLIDLLLSTELASSRGDARRLIEGGAVSVNGDKVNQDFTINSRSLIKKGKNSFALAR